MSFRQLGVGVRLCLAVLFQLCRPPPVHAAHIKPQSRHFAWTDVGQLRSILIACRQQQMSQRVGCLSGAFFQDTTACSELPAHATCKVITRSPRTHWVK